MSAGFLDIGPRNARTTILLAHGAGAPMDSDAMTGAADALASEGFRVVRFEFAYMADRRNGGKRRPPPKAELLIPEYEAAIAALEVKGPLIIGGKSMGGRIASILADGLHTSGRIVGLLCLGYPFHPPDKPEQLRTAHLKTLKTPALIFQGTRDPFGSRDEVGSYRLSDAIEIVWLEDGDHDLKPRKSVSGFTNADHLRTMASATRVWAGQMAGAER
jgi:predicted alpha/beta-hydrolase family hydrolase